MTWIVKHGAFHRLMALGNHMKKVEFNGLSETVSSPVIQVSSDFVLVDEKVRIIAYGLTPGQAVTLQAYFEESGKPFGSCGHYVADRDGKIDTFENAALGGTFQGIEPMGLFSSSKSTPGVKVSRLLKADPMSPYEIVIALQDGFQDFENLQWTYSLNSLASCKLQRTYAAPGVRSFPLHENGLHGVLMVPPGEGPFSAVIDVFGVAGGIRGYRAALLASHGIAALALGYFNYEDLPTNKAFDWLASHPLIDPTSLGGISTCVGGGYIQFIASMRPAMKCLATINCTGVPFGKHQTVEGEDVVVGQLRLENITLTEGLASFRNMFALEETNVWNFCPSWRHGAKHLWLIGLDDQCVNPAVFKAFFSTVPPQFQKNYTFLTYPGAGHLLEPPYSPLWRSNYMPLVFERPLLWGGEPELHIQAQEKSWPKLLAFLHEHLGKVKCKDLNCVDIKGM